MTTTTNKKTTGTYYTPPLLADFMVRHVFMSYKFGDDIKILEPSVGDGVFFRSLFDNSTFKGRGFKISDHVKSLNIEAVEKDKNAINVCKSNTKKYLNASRKVTYLNQDYLEYWKENTQKFDLVIGNPPYVKTHHLSDKQIKICEAIHKRSGLSEKKIKNIWTSFLIGGAQSLNDKGVLCLVLPAEILQVIYAKELRNF